MKNTLFEKFNFLFFDLESTKINNNFYSQNKNQYIDLLFMDNYIEDYFLMKIFNKDFEKEWTHFGLMVKKFHEIHDNDLTKVCYKINNNHFYPYQEYLKTKYLTEFIKNIIKRNFNIIKDNSEINNNPELWYKADSIKPNKNIFEDDINIKKGYNNYHITEQKLKINYRFNKFDNENNKYNKYILPNNNIQFLNTFYRNKITKIKSEFPNLNKYLNKLIIKNLELQKKYNFINNKIQLLNKANEINIKNEKNLSFNDLIDLLDKKKDLTKKIIKEKNDIQNGILFITNIKNL